MLFGVYHAPLVPVRDTGVVLCYPVGQEYMRSHRSFCRLASMLASNGFPVLRFDYYATGDSPGESGEGNIGEWTGNISAAIEELKGGCDIDKVCLIGMRMGAALAILSASDRLDVDSMVLWNPVVSGGYYLDEITDMHQEWLRGSFAKAQHSKDSYVPLEVLGFVVPEILEQELVNIDLMNLKSSPAKAIQLLETGRQERLLPFLEHLKLLGADVSYNQYPGFDVWIKKDDEESKALVPTMVLQRISCWLSEGTA